MNLLNRKTRPPEAWELADAAEWSRRALDLRFDPVRAGERLEDEDARELFRLQRKATVKSVDGHSGSNLRQLTAEERRELERLTEKAAGLEEGTLEKRRADRKAVAEIRALGREARRAGLLPAQEVGLFKVIGDPVARRHLAVVHVTTLSLIVAQIARGEPFGGRRNRNRVEGVGLDAALVVDTNFAAIHSGAVESSAYGDLANWRRSVEWLAKHRWLKLGRDGHEWRISLGRRTLAALGHRPPADRPTPTPDGESDGR